MHMELQNFTEIEETLFWDAPNYSQLGIFVQSTLLDFIGNEHHFDGSSEWNGPPTTRKRYQLVSDWEASLTNSPDELHIRLFSDKTNRHLSLWLYGSDQPGRIIMTLPDTEVEEGKSFIKEMFQILQLSLKKDVTAKRVQLNRIYSADQSVGQEWFSSFIVQMEALLQKRNRVHCQCTLSRPPSYEYTYNQISDWKSNLFNNWGNLSQVSCFLHNVDEYVGVAWNIDRNEFRLSVQSSQEERVDRLLGSLEKQAGLMPFVDSPLRQRLEGEQSIYFTKKVMDWEWFDSSMKELLKYLNKEIIYSDFSVYKLAEQPQPMTWEDKEPWLAFIHENWANISEAYCNISTSNLKFTFRCEPIHDWVSLRIQAPLRSRVLEITQDLQEKLGLQPIEGVSYGTVRSSGYYSIGNWSNPGFAKAVEHAVSQFPKYSLKQAEIIEEKGESERKHNAFSDFKSFVERLAKGKRYIAAHLQIKGPSGAQMGIHVLNKCTKLELKSHLSPDKFPEFVKSFDEELDLKKIAETKEQAESQNKSLKDSFLVLILLPLFTAVLTSTVLSEQFRTAAIPKYSLQIVSPNSEDGKPIVLPTQQFEVYWKLQSERWFQKKIDIDSPASYRLFGKGSLIEHKKNVRPGVKLNLSPGTYQMEVTSVPSGEQRSVTFTITASKSNNLRP
jgi:hypothetical protein